jgi:hypothetical protein
MFCQQAKHARRGSTNSTSDDEWNIGDQSAKDTQNPPCGGFCYTGEMETHFENTKLDWCKDELKALLNRLSAGNYQKSAEVVFEHLAHTGVETDLNPELKQKPTLKEFTSAS